MWSPTTQTQYTPTNNNSNSNGNNKSTPGPSSGVIHHEFVDYQGPTFQFTPTTSTRNETTSKGKAEKHAVVVFGTTGVGKSSLIRLFCDPSGSDIKVSSSSASTTKDCRLYQECGAAHTDSRGRVADSSRVWLDTQGTDDTDMIDCDEKVLKSIFHKLFQHKIRKIKLVWMVGGDLTKENEELYQQARFMKALLKTEHENENENDSQNIWQSCLIIAKQKPLQPNQHTIAGILSIMAGNDEPQHTNIIGFTAFDWMSAADKKQDMMLQLLLSQMKTQKNEDALATLSLTTFSYLTNTQIVNQVNASLAKMKCLNLEYLTEKCIRCGVVGDHRLIYATCHSSIQYYHENHKNLEWYHPRDDTKLVHPGQTTVKKDVGNSIVNKSAIVSAGMLTAGAVAATMTLGLALPTLGLALPPSAVVGIAASSGITAGAVGLGAERKRVLEKNTVYMCCGKNVAEEQKKAEEDVDAVGCKLVYSCCGYCACALSQTEAENGNCICVRSQKKRGCYARYTCCGGGINSRGCKKRCSTCSVEWGCPPGCSITIDEALISC